MNKSSHSLLLWISLATTCAVAATAVLWPSARDAKRASQTAADGGPTARVTPRSAQQGDTRVYDFDLGSGLEVEEGGSLLDVAVAGRWKLQTIKVSAGRTTLASTLQVSRFSSHGKDNQASAELAEMQKQLAEPFFFTLDADGMIVGSRAPARTTGVVEGVVRALAGYAQVHRGALQRDRFDSTEIDSTGRYSARYERTAPGNWHKSKLAYLDVLGVVGQVPTGELVPEITESKTLLTLERGDLKTLALTEQILLRGLQMPTMRSRTKLTLALVEHALVPLDSALLAAHDKASPEQPLYARVSTELELARMREERARKYDIEGIAEAFEQVKPDDRRTPVHLFQLARDLLRTRADAAQDTVAMIREQKTRAPFWIDALGNAGTPEAQQALATLYHEGTLEDPYLQRRIVRALSLVEQHTEETVAFLKGLESHPQMGVQAKLGLGTAANRLATREPERAHALVEHLLAGLRSARGEADSVNYIKALGNSGARTVIPALDAKLNTDNALVRAQAMRALRLMPEGDADSVLAVQIRADDDYKVRSAAIRAVRRRAPTEVVGRALYESVQNEKADLPRSELYQTLLSWSEDAPYREEALAWARAHETDAKLLELLGKDG